MTVAFVAIGAWRFNQDSIAWTAGATELLVAALTEVTE